MRRFRFRTGTLAAALLLAGLGVAGLALVRAQKAGAPPAAADPVTGAVVAAAAPAIHPVAIRPGPPTPTLDTGLRDADGQPVTAACSTCHTTTEPNVTRQTAHDLQPPHQGLEYAHGSLTCLSCHNASNYDTLRLADGRSMEYPDVMTLCAQCHGTQKRDFDHGSHGGMTGHWDLTRGGRLRNNCLNCHDPHHPAFPLVRPVLPPRDRLSVPPPTDH